MESTASVAYSSRSEDFMKITVNKTGKYLIRFKATVGNAQAEFEIIKYLNKDEKVGPLEIDSITVIEFDEEEVK
jgi:hypothetical protein